MVKLFRIDNRIFCDDALFEKYLNRVDEARRKKVNALLKREDKNASLAAGVILPAALEFCGFNGEIKLTVGEFGKPYLSSPEGVFFNASHSGDYTLLALSSKEVGVDVQRAKPIDLKVAERFFTPEEYRSIESSENPEESFFRIWTVKESYLKARGVGLKNQLASFGVVFTQDGVILQGAEDKEKWRIKEYKFPDGYFAACCAEEELFDDKITDLRPR